MSTPAAPAPVIAALDVAYRADEAGADIAAAACARAAGWTAAEPLDVTTTIFRGAGAYQAGQFYKRELGALLAVLQEAPPSEVLLIDGYVWLDAAGAPGLGARLYAALGGRRAVVGVAKSALKNDAHSASVRRGGSARPLQVTAAGLDLAAAAEAVAGMHGTARLPSLLRLVDRAARDALTEAGWRA